MIFRVKGWEVSLVQCGDGYCAELKLAGGLQISNVKVYGVNSLNPNLLLKVEKVEADYVVIGSRQMGGGCGGSKQQNKVTLHTRQPKTHITSESNQKVAFAYAKAILKLASSGLLYNLPLKELNDIPIETVESPFPIFELLLNALSDITIWSSHFRFQIRYTLARLSRRYMLYSVIFYPTLNEIRKEEIRKRFDEIKHMADVQRFAIDSGVKAELRIMSSLIELLSTNKRWLTTLRIYAKTLLKLYTCNYPIPLLLKAFAFFNRFCVVNSKMAKVELGYNY